jgi:8-oxo-dGTP pyrophosphatase MutT (NUDIX family)
MPEPTRRKEATQPGVAGPHGRRHSAVTSCGVLLLCLEREILLGHATGSKRFDIPKGLAEPGESELEAALREMHEEFGMRLRNPLPLALGTFAYRPGKDLALFAALIARIDTSPLHCRSTFRDRFGREQPEMDGYRWVPFDGVADACAPAMAKVLMAPDRLGTTLAKLRAAEAPEAPIVD